jgi:hypothetical protein
MKKWLVLVMLGMFMAAAMVGCGKKDKADEEKSEEPAE